MTGYRTDMDGDDDTPEGDSDEDYLSDMSEADMSDSDDEGTGLIFINMFTVNLV